MFRICSGPKFKLTQLRNQVASAVTGNGLRLRSAASANYRMPAFGLRWFSSPRSNSVSVICSRRMSSRRVSMSSR
jgi:hypothetical protein